MHNARLRAVLTGGLLGGAGDILFAIAFAGIHGRTPVWLLQTVATGLLGQAAYDGGIPAALLGLAGHFTMSFLWATLFVTLASRFPQLVEKPALSGPAYGVLVFLAMRLVILPASAFPYPVSFKLESAGPDLLSHMFLFGLPIALMAARALAPRRLA
jgi:uncharacterized membrane protein YagU involved in acid resistance